MAFKDKNKIKCSIPVKHNMDIKREWKFYTTPRQNGKLSLKPKKKNTGNSVTECIAENLNIIQSTDSILIIGDESFYPFIHKQYSTLKYLKKEPFVAVVPPGLPLSSTRNLNIHSIQIPHMEEPWPNYELPQRTSIKTEHRG